MQITKYENWFHRDDTCFYTNVFLDKGILHIFTQLYGGSKEYECENVLNYAATVYIEERGKTVYNVFKECVRGMMSHLNEEEYKKWCIDYCLDDYTEHTFDLVFALEGYVELEDGRNVAPSNLVVGDVW